MSLQISLNNLHLLFDLFLSLAFFITIHIERNVQKSSTAIDIGFHCYDEIYYKQHDPPSQLKKPARANDIFPWHSQQHAAVKNHSKAINQV